VRTTGNQSLQHLIGASSVLATSGARDVCSAVRTDSDMIRADISQSEARGLPDSSAASSSVILGHATSMMHDVKGSCSFVYKGLTNARAQGLHELLNNGTHQAKRYIRNENRPHVWSRRCSKTRSRSDPRQGSSSGAEPDRLSVHSY
jgi:hypothetical protein